MKKVIAFLILITFILFPATVNSLKKQTQKIDSDIKKNQENIKVAKKQETETSKQLEEIEKELNISYPTVRKNLDSIILALGYNLSEEENEDFNKDILNKLDKGEISADEAINLLNKKR